MVSYALVLWPLTLYLSGCWQAQSAKWPKTKHNSKPTQTLGSSLQNSPRICIKVRLPRICTKVRFMCNAKGQAEQSHTHGHAYFMKIPYEHKHAALMCSNVCISSVYLDKARWPPSRCVMFKGNNECLPLTCNGKHQVRPRTTCTAICTLANNLESSFVAQTLKKAHTIACIHAHHLHTNSHRATHRGFMVPGPAAQNAA